MLMQEAHQCRIIGKRSIDYACLKEEHGKATLEPELVLNKGGSRIADTCDSRS